MTLPGPVGSIPDRLAGWLLAGAASLVAIAVLWPAPTREPLRRSTAYACAMLARRLRAEAECVRGGFGPKRTAALGALAGEADAAVAALRTSFFGTPYRPTGLTTATRTLVRLVDEVVWLDSGPSHALRIPAGLRRANRPQGAEWRGAIHDGCR